MDRVPPEALLTAYPEPIGRIAHRLRAVVLRAVPNAIEAVRPGWSLIGYDVPADRRKVYFCYVAPEREHVHLGFEYGIFMADTEGVLLGAGVTRQVRWVTHREGDPIDEPLLESLVREAARVALMGRRGRLLSSVDWGAAPSR